MVCCAPTRRSKHVPKGALSNLGSLTPDIQWYPGHIAKAERTLRDALRLVDVVIEVRDSRIPISTSHPLVRQWVGHKAHILAMNRVDLVPDRARSDWRNHLRTAASTPENVRFINARQGHGVRELKKLAVRMGDGMNAKRGRKGLLPRAVRCIVIGYPNVGKSALINRLCGRNSAKSANKPGVTRNYQWIRMAKDIELLDMPGIIPMKLISQESALRLAICDDIGQGAYDYQNIAALMIEELKGIRRVDEAYFDHSVLVERFKTDWQGVSGEEFLHMAADKVCKGDVERTAVRLLTEFRSGILGKVALEAPSMLRDES